MIHIQRHVLKYGAITLTNLQNQLAYIWDTINRSLFIVFIMFIFTQLWLTVYGAQNQEQIAGLTLANVIWYLLFAEMMEIGKFRHDVKISDEVKDGTIAYTMLRPVNYLAYHFFNGLGDTIVRRTLIFLLGMPIAVYYVGWPIIDWRTLPFVGVLALGSTIIDFFALSMIGLLAFVTEDTGSFRLIYQKIVFIMGGLMLPLDFLPDWLRQIALLLPFQLTTYAPAKLFVAFSWEEFQRYLLLQIFWGIVMALMLWRQYRWAIRRLSVNGG